MCLALANAQQLEWAFALGNGIGNSVAIDQQQNVVVTGFFDGQIDFDPGVGVDTITSIGTNDIFVAKYDASGNHLWAFGIGTGQYQQVSALGAHVDAGGNIIITGWIVGGTGDFDPGPGTSILNPHGYESLFLARYDANGNYLWAFTLGDTTTTVEENGYSVWTDAAGNIMLAGSFQDTVDFDPGPGAHILGANPYPAAFLASYDQNGNYRWAMPLPGAAAYTASGDANGDVYMAGSFGGTVDFDPGAGVHNVVALGVSDIFLAKYDNSGNYLWAFGIGAPGGWSQAVGKCVAVDNSGKVLLTGYFGGVADFDPGAGTHNMPGGTQSAFLAKYNAAGNFLGSIHSSNGNAIAGNGVATDAANNVYWAGGFDVTSNFDANGTFNLTPVGIQDIFVAKYDSSGHFAWAFNAGAAGKYNVAGSIACDAAGDFWLTGQLSKDSVDFDPSFGVYNTHATASQNSYVAKYNSLPLAVNEVVNDISLGLFPNPAHDKIYVDAGTDARSVTIFNCVGEKLMEQKVTGAREIDISRLAPGLYFISCGNTAQKFIKE